MKTKNSLRCHVFGLLAVLAACATQPAGDSNKDASGKDVSSGEEIVWVAQAYPTGKKETSALLVERGTPAEVQVGVPYDYSIKVTNLTDYTLADVNVRESAATSFQVSNTAPQAAVQGNNLRWTFETLGPRESRTIRVSGAAAAEGSVENSCEVTWRALLVTRTQAVQPRLELIKTAPADALQCDPILLVYRVKNAGTGTARQVVLEERLPKGFTTEAGELTIRREVGAIPSGQSQEIVIRCKATERGTFHGAASVTGAGGLSATSDTTSTLVTLPELLIEQSGPPKSFIDGTLRYVLILKNMGDGPAQDTWLECPVPAGTVFTEASDDGKPVQGKVLWSLGTILPGESRQIFLRVKAVEAMTTQATASVRAHCVDPVTASVETVIVGVPTLLLEVSDLADPVAVGQEATYEIRVRNQGTAPANNIRISCTLENAMEFGAATGATKGSLSGSTITFAPLEKLAAKARASWRVTVKAARAGDVRFKVVLTSAESQRPVEQTEATNFFQ